LSVSIQGEKVVKSPMGPYPGFPHADVRNTEFNRGGFRVKLLDGGMHLTPPSTGRRRGQVD
jgi:hypothetical protein